jgi:hypothetical protein
MKSSESAASPASTSSSIFFDRPTASASILGERSFKKNEDYSKASRGGSGSEEKLPLRLRFFSRSQPSFHW